MVRTQASLADELGIERWHSIVGGSMGGMQALEWAVMYPDRVGSLVARVLDRPGLRAADRLEPHRAFGDRC